MSPEQSIVEIRSQVPNSGRYNILVKFYQPNHAKFDVLYKIDADKLSYDGKLNLRNCPSNSGCRVLIEQNNGAKSFELEQNVTITFTVITKCIFIHLKLMFIWIQSNGFYFFLDSKSTFTVINKLFLMNVFCDLI